MRQIQLKDSQGNLYPAIADYKISELYIGKLVQGVPNPSNASISNDAASVCMANNVCVPYIGVEIEVFMPDTLQCKIYYNTGTKDMDGVHTSLANNAQSSILANASRWQFPLGTSSSADAMVYRIAFSRKSGGPLYPQEVQDEVTNGRIRLSYKAERQNIVERNMDMMSAVKSAMFRHYPNDSLYKHSVPNMPVLVHGTDFHADYYRLKNLSELGTAIHADAVLATGDFLMNVGYDGLDWVKDAFAEQPGTLPAIVCPGNHDSWHMTSAEFYNLVTNPLKARFGYTTPSGVSSPTFFYKDIPNRQLRIISLNYLVTTTGNWHATNITGAQLQWFINTLGTTPANYGVVVCIHSPECRIDRIPGKDDFYEPDFMSSNTPAQPMKSLYDIIDAFISRGTCSGTMNDYSGATSYNANFSTIASGVEFIAWCTGHFHEDCVGYVSGTSQPQLNLNLHVGNGLTGFYMKSFGRNGWGKSQDCLNVYGIDREKKEVRIVRIGANTNYRFSQRTCMTVSYVGSNDIDRHIYNSPIVTISDSSFTAEMLQADVLHKFTNPNLGAVKINGLKTYNDEREHEFKLQFKAGTATSLVLPSSVVWAWEDEPTFSQGKTYQVSIEDNLAMYVEF